MYKHHVDSLDDNCWCDLFDYSSLLEDVAPPPPPPPPDDLILNHQPLSENAVVSLDDSAEIEHRRKRGRCDESGRTRTKADRERMRREKLNERFSELSAILEPGRPVKTEKTAILGDAIRILNRLKAESQEYAETNKRLLEEMENLKAEKNELREEKIILKADKERLAQWLKTMPAHPPVYEYQAEANKVPIIPSYGFIPMWHYLPQSTRDTSQDHELRPPAA